MSTEPHLDVESQELTEVAPSSECEILSATSVDARLNSPANLVNRLAVYRPLHQHKVNGRVDLPPLLRTIIGAAANVSEDTQKSLGDTFGVDQSTVSNAKHGKVNGKGNGDLAVKIAQSVDKVKEKAYDRLVSLFENNISEENLATLKTREAISAAKDIAAVIDRISPKSGDNGNKIAFVVYAPRIRGEQEYESIEVASHVP